MTDREKAIVMAYTGICMLTGDKFQIFHKYVEDIMGRPIWTHEMVSKSIADEISEKSKDDFIALCTDESSSENPNRWIPVSEKLPEEGIEVLVWYRYWRYGEYNNWYYAYGIGYQFDDYWSVIDGGTKTTVYAWQELPEPYEPQESEEV